MVSLKSILTLMIGLILIGVLIYINNPQRLVETLEKSNKMLILLSTLALIGMHVVLALRIQYIGRLLREKISFLDAFKAHMFGMLISEFTPGRGGYFLSSAYLRKRGIDSGKALTSLVSGQPFDFASKFIGASIGFILLLNLDISFLLIPFLVSIFLFLIVFSRRFSSKIEDVAKKTIYKFHYMRLPIKKAIEYLKEMNKHSKIVAKKWYVIMGYILFSYSLRITNWFLLFYSVNATLSNNVVHDWLYFYLLQPLINIVEFIPLPTPAGSGVTESAAILVLGKFGIKASKALAFALLARMQTLLVSFIFGYFPMNETAKFIKEKLF